MLSFGFLRQAVIAIAQVRPRLSLCSSDWSGTLALPPEYWDSVTPGYGSNCSVMFKPVSLAWRKGRSDSVRGQMGPGSRRCSSEGLFLVVHLHAETLQLCPTRLPPANFISFTDEEEIAFLITLPESICRQHLKCWWGFKAFYSGLEGEA